GVRRISKKLSYEIDLRNFWLQVEDAGSHSAQRKSGSFGGESLRLCHRVRQRFHRVRRKRCTQWHFVSVAAWRNQGGVRGRRVWQEHFAQARHWFVAS